MRLCFAGTPLPLDHALLQQRHLGLVLLQLSYPVQTVDLRRRCERTPSLQRGLGLDELEAGADGTSAVGGVGLALGEVMGTGIHEKCTPME